MQGKGIEVEEENAPYQEQDQNDLQREPHLRCTLRRVSHSTEPVHRAKRLPRNNQRFPHVRCQEEQTPPCFCTPHSLYCREPSCSRWDRWQQSPRLQTSPWA